MSDEEPKTETPAETPPAPAKEKRVIKFLTKEQIAEIYRRRTNKEKNGDIAKAMGLDQATTSQCYITFKNDYVDSRKKKFSKQVYLNAAAIIRAERKKEESRQPDLFTAPTPESKPAKQTSLEALRETIKALQEIADRMENENKHRRQILEEGGVI